MFGSLVGGSVVKNPPANAEVAGDVDLISGLGGSLGVGNGNPLQYSCQDNPIDRTLSKGSPRVGHN